MGVKQWSSRSLFGSPPKIKEVIEIPEVAICGPASQPKGNRTPQTNVGKILRVPYQISEAVYRATLILSNVLSVI